MRPLIVLCDNKGCTCRTKCSLYGRVDAARVVDQYDWTCERRNLTLGKAWVHQLWDFERGSLLAYRQFMEKDVFG